MTTLTELQAQYREAAINTSSGDPRVANRWHDKMHNAYKELQTSEEGRNLILILMSDVSPHVQCWAASHSLEWSADHATTILEGLRDRGGECSFDAKMVLEEFQKGRLSFDY